jgi:hypothetical protein
MLLLVKQVFASSVRRELEKEATNQHPLITAAGLLAVELL